MLEKNSSHVFNKNREERRRKQTKFLLIGLLFTMVVMVLVIAILRKPNFQIQTITPIGTEAMNPDDITNYVQQNISGNYAWVIPKTNIFFFSKKHLEQQILTQFPNLTKAVVAFRNTQEITITVLEKKPSYIWCKNNTCFFIDDQGVLFKEAPIFDDGVYITFEGGKISEEAPLGARFIDQELFQKIQELIKSFQQIPIEITRVTYQETGDIVFHVATIQGIIVGQTSSIIISQNISIDRIIQTLNLLLADTAFEQDLKTKSTSLQSIDLRFDGKIYYKFN